MKVSIQIPVNTGTAFLKDALESIHRQTYQDFEVIVVDDGSGEDLSEIVSKYEKVRFVRQEHLGVAAARNRALSCSSGEVIAFLDADDLWTEEKLEKQMHYLNNHPECMIVFSGTENFTEIPSELLNERQKQILGTLLSKCLVSSCVRKEVFETYGNFLETCNYGEDTELMARWAACGVSLDHCIHDMLYLRRVHAENMSLRHKKAGKKEYLELLATAFRKARKNTESGVR